MHLLISTMKLLYISDEEPQNNRNHPGKISYQCDADLLFFFKRNNHVFFSPTFFLYLYLSLWPLFSFLFICPLLSSPYPPPNILSPPCLSVCKVGFYRSLLESLACSKCPPHSVARLMGATACSCEDGYFKLDSDPSNMACTREDITPLYLLMLTFKAFVYPNASLYF